MLARLESWLQVGGVASRHEQLDRLMCVNTPVFMLSLFGAGLVCWQYAEGPARTALLVWLGLFLGVSLVRRIGGVLFMRRVALGASMDDTSRRRWVIWGVGSTLV